MRANTTPLIHGAGVRLLEASDASFLAAAYAANKEHLAPWEPKRSDDFFTVEHQRKIIDIKLAHHAGGYELPWVLVADHHIIGCLTLAGIVRGSFLSANLGYWVDRTYNGLGIGSAAVAFAVREAKEIGLHRVQAATLLHNMGSQKILEREGFKEIGVAPAYLEIAGSWQDHRLYQRILF